MIRAASKNDMESVYALICNMEQKVFDKDEFKKIFIEHIRHNNRPIFIFEQDNEVLGALNLRIEYQLHHCAKIAEIMELSVKEGLRSKGIGKKLFDAACQRAKDDGCLQIEVCCNQLRTNAHRFYEREGMHKFHYKFSMDLTGNVMTENKLGI
nr:GNAT family N-acetyltransferase [uncultured Caproiciproducens sp.]